MTEDNRSKAIHKKLLKLTEFEKNRIKILADRYAGGNETAWIIYGALNAPRKNISEKDFHHSTRRKKPV